MNHPAEDLQQKLLRLGCSPDQVIETFTHSGGAGGQNVNKLATCVQLRFPPAGIAIKMQKHRTQGANRRAAWTLLLKTLEEAKKRRKATLLAENELRRRQKALRPSWLKARILSLKHHQADKKKARTKQRLGDEE